MHTLGVMLIYPSMVCYTFWERGAHSGSVAYLSKYGLALRSGNECQCSGNTTVYWMDVQDGLLEASVITPMPLLGVDRESSLHKNQLREMSFRCMQNIESVDWEPVVQISRLRPDGLIYKEYYKARDRITNAHQMRSAHAGARLSAPRRAGVVIGRDRTGLVLGTPRREALASIRPRSFSQTRSNTDADIDIEPQSRRSLDPVTIMRSKMAGGIEVELTWNAAEQDFHSTTWNVLLIGRASASNSYVFGLKLSPSKFSDLAINGSQYWENNPILIPMLFDNIGTSSSLPLDTPHW
ncbi:hypothetical protein RIF29_14148 [Crotalaria pallida]|uniref:Uncharacterized protein n=1 Tax=Crotalaria pallida TaxID=3830 RepID=A0AAN9FAT0_CROPI